MAKKAPITPDAIVALVQNLREVRDRVVKKEKDMDSELAKFRVASQKLLQEESKKFSEASQKQLQEESTKLRETSQKLQEELKSIMELKRKVQNCKCDFKPSSDTAATVKKPQPQKISSPASGAPPNKKFKSDPDKSQTSQVANATPATGQKAAEPNKISDSAIKVINTTNKSVEKECYNCGRKGHLVKECWRPGGGAAATKKITPNVTKNTTQFNTDEHKCRNCGKFGHSIAECWQPGGGAEHNPEMPKEKTCFKCGQKGHVKIECWNTNSDDISTFRRPPEEVMQCRNCGAFDHIFEECMRPGGGAIPRARHDSSDRYERFSPRPEAFYRGHEERMQCRNCGDWDHVAEECVRPGGGAAPRPRLASPGIYDIHDPRDEIYRRTPDIDEKYCRSCGGRGHYTEECRNRGGNSYDPRRDDPKSLAGHYLQEVLREWESAF